MSKKYKKHTLDKRIKWLKAIEDGDSVNHVSIVYGIDHSELMTLWLRYQRDGPLALKKKDYVQSSGYDREVILRDIEDNCLTLPEAAAKYSISLYAIKSWRRRVRNSGIKELYNEKKRGRPPKDMGRPRKKKPEEMTELERLRYENERLRAENALLKKVRALVEEREARLREIGRKPSKD
jgi:transposase-like protein